MYNVLTVFVQHDMIGKMVWFQLLIKKLAKKNTEGFPPKRILSIEVLSLHEKWRRKLAKYNFKYKPVLKPSLKVIDKSKSNS